MTLDLQTLDEVSATEAIRAVADLAKENGIKWALVGEVAMALYDSDRLTKDIDVIASELLPARFPVAGKLRQGGERYEIATSKRATSVDWIIRNDGFKPMFHEALAEAVEVKGLPVLTPEWLVILKFIAGRFKDQEDAVFLLSRPGLVDRSVIKDKIVKHVGREAWQLAKSGYQRWFDMADGRTAEEERNRNDGYIDS
ncbi:MAG TPA: hypothetical protein PKA82_08760 [Pyrinomonadaceae bacterium]|nr:hypothetical protein [Pyrinomonadaceae bacterium]